MHRDPVWQPLHDELQRWADHGRTAKLWFRDDDAIEPTPALDRLLALSGEFSVPVTLAVIPALTGRTLASRLGVEQHVAVAVHGWSHQNHATEREKKQELGAHRPADVVLGTLQAAFGTLRDLYPQQFVPVLVPPWNRIAPELVPELPAIGFRALSVFGREGSFMPMTEINTHVDIMDWHGTRGCRPHADIVADLVAQLRLRMDASEEPIGILTHHLVHDRTAWDFIRQLFQETGDLATIGWHPVSDFVG